MGEKTSRALRRTARKVLKYHYDEFLEDVAKCKFTDRLRIAWRVVKSKKKKINDSQI